MSRRYSKSCVAPHGSGWKYKRAVPTEMRAVVGRKVWVKMLGRDKTQAEIAALRLSAEHKELVDRLRKLSQADLRTIVARGGYDAFIASARRAEHDADIASRVHPSHCRDGTRPERR
jgi:hypothetical protein